MHARQTLEQNRKPLTCIIFRGKQNIALRGHRNESASPTDGSLETAGNSGNFQALLQFRMESGDNDLKQHFSSADKNAQYRSPRIQNGLIASCGEWIKEKIVARAGKRSTFLLVQMKQQKWPTKSSCHLSSVSLMQPEPP